MRARCVVLFAALAAAGCTTPKYAQFPPLPADVACQRVECGRFSLLVPTHWRAMGEATADAMYFVEDPPANGEIRAYRSVIAVARPMVAGDTPEAIAQAGLAAVRASHAKDDLHELAVGTATLAGRDCVFLRGTITPSSYDVVIETLNYFVPGDAGAIALEFRVPEGQFDAAQPGFAAIAQSLQTTIAPPRFGGDLLWLDGDRIGMLAPDGWQRVVDPAPSLAAFTLADGEAHCDLSTATSANGFDLDRLAKGYERDKAKEWPDLRVTAIERGVRAGRVFARFRGAYRDELGTVFVDDTFFVVGDRLDRVLCRVPAAERDRALPTVDRIVGSLRWR